MNAIAILEGDEKAAGNWKCAFEYKAYIARLIGLTDEKREKINVFGQNEGETRLCSKNSNKKNRVCFVCTDPVPDEESILEIYGLRWKIEVCFKTCKSLLKLHTECHNTSYDAIASHLVTVSIRYMILTISKLDNIDDRSLKGIMEGIKCEVVSDALLKQCNIFTSFIFKFGKDCFRLTEEGCKQFIAEFIR